MKTTALLANASHELRSPLARIRMATELAGDDAPPAFRDLVRREIAELDRLIDEILLASRLEARGSDVGTFEAVDLAAITMEECGRAGVHLMCVFDGNGVVIDGMATLARRAVRLLVEAAIRYGSGSASANLRCESGFVVLRVNDGGPGVPPGERERIFEPFYRTPVAGEHRTGAGLGLALARSIAQRHGGWVHCEGAPNGTSFVLRMPATQPSLRN